jgi:uncharacterized protein with PQ loop repeat
MSKNPKYKWISVIAGIFIILGFSNLVLRVHNTKETEHLTYTWILLVLTAQTSLFIYGFLNNFYGIYLPAFIICILLLYIVYIKSNYETFNKL